MHMHTYIEVLTVCFKSDAFAYITDNARCKN